MAIDDDAFEPTLADRTLELGERGRRIGDRQRRQAEEPRRVAPDGVRERGVRASGEGCRLLDSELLDARRRQRQRLHGHAGGVHRRDPAVAHIDELIDERSEPPADPFRLFLQPAARAVEVGGRGEMFLKGDGAHCRTPSGRRDEFSASAPPPHIES